MVSNINLHPYKAAPAGKKANKKERAKKDKGDEADAAAAPAEVRRCRLNTPG